MEEDIKNVEYAIKHFNGRFKDCVSIGNLLTRYKQLKQENNNYKAAAIINDSLYQEVCNKNKELEEDYTSVYLKGVYDEREKWRIEIKEKIEEIDKWLDNGKYARYGMNPYELKAQKEVLEELLRRR